VLRHNQYVFAFTLPVALVVVCVQFLIWRSPSLHPVILALIVVVLLPGWVFGILASPWRFTFYDQEFEVRCLVRPHRRVAKSSATLLTHGKKKRSAVVYVGTGRKTRDTYMFVGPQLPFQRSRTRRTLETLEQHGYLVTGQFPER